MIPLFMLDTIQKDDFSARLLTWFSAAKRPLPWRAEYAPYHVWVSEIMLQQTQMERAVAYYTAWMRRFPTIHSVAEASEEEVLKAWEGLGYYSRAKNLLAAARRIVEEHQGRFPECPDAIRALPGVGEYTAGAIGAIAFNRVEAAVDANVLRIFSRICDIDVPVTHPGVKKFVSESVLSLTPPQAPRMFAQGLMELGALVCSKKSECALCPLPDYCEARRLGTVAKRPKSGVKKTYSSLEMVTGIIRSQGRVFIQKRPPYGVWAGLWEFPGGCIEAGESPEEALIREIVEETEFTVSIREKIGVFQHAYTNCRVAMHAYFCDIEDPPPKPVLHAATESKWVFPDMTGTVAFPAGHRKLLEHLGWRR